MGGGLVLELFFINDDIWLVLTIFYSYEIPDKTFACNSH